MTTEQFLHELTTTCGSETTFKYIKNIGAFEYIESICSRKTISSDVVRASFYWDKTNEGERYWIDVCDELRMVTA